MGGAAVGLLQLASITGGASVAVDARGSSLGARVDALESKFEAELQQAEERMRSELRSELDQVKGELKKMGGRLDHCEAEAAALGREAVAVTVSDSGPEMEPDSADLQDHEPSTSPEADQTPTPAAGTVRGCGGTAACGADHKHDPPSKDLRRAITPLWSAAASGRAMRCHCRQLHADRLLFDGRRW